ncbi:MAG: hypothetical protein KAJ28_08030, partial [Flavobacteriaceae bacterium]|nr:hypothetical protein [Flavobacteriaceae bacterium]
FSQSSNGNAGEQQSLDYNFRRMQTFGSAVTFYNPKRQTDGTFYLFDKWNNYTIIQTEDNQKFVLRNINLNLERHTFESKVEGDSIFTFNFNNIDRFIVNGRTYKNFYWNDDNKVYEIIFESNKFQILKGFKVELIEGSANPMVNRKNDKYIRREYYFLRKDDKIESFKFKKKRILKLLSNNDAETNKIETYAKQNNLSFKKESDVQRILDYSVKK